jgi:hypothetical protein
LSLPTPQVVRNHIESVNDKPMQMCLKATYLLGAARISEIVSKAPKGEKAYGPKAHEVGITQFTGIVDSKILEALATHKNIESALYPEPVAVFTVRMAKRHLQPGEPIPSRKVGLPLDKKYEPWTQQLYDYYREFKSDDFVFPFDRKQVWRYVSEHKVFDGLTYPIEKYVWMPKNGKEKKTILPHSKPFKLHALRHLRISELRRFYRIKGEDLAVYVGWSLHTTIAKEGVRIPQMTSTYDPEIYQDWQSYFPKLLKTRE